MASYRKREGKLGTTWQARVHVSGKSSVKSFPTRTAAKKWATAEEAALITRATSPDGRKDAKGITVLQALTDWGERRSDTKKTRHSDWLLKRFKEEFVFANTQITKLTSTDLEEYFIARAETVSPQTVAIELSFFRVFWENVALRYDIPHDVVKNTRKMLKNDNK